MNLQQHHFENLEAGNFSFHICNLVYYKVYHGGWIHLGLLAFRILSIESYFKQNTFLKLELFLFSGESLGGGVGVHNELRLRERAIVSEQPHSISDWHECWKLNLPRPLIIAIFLSDTSPPPSFSSFFFFFFFFHHYSPQSLALAFLMIDVHSVLSKALVLHLFTPIFLKFNSTSSIYLNLGLPFFTPPPTGLPASNFFTVLSPSIVTTYPGLYILYLQYNTWRFKLL